MAEIEQKLDLILTELRELRNRVDNLPREDLPENFLLSEAASYLKLSRSHIYDLIRQKKLFPMQRKKYGKISFTKEELIRYQKSIETLTLKIH